MDHVDRHGHGVKSTSFIPKEPVLRVLPVQWDAQPLHKSQRPVTQLYSHSQDSSMTRAPS